MTAIPWQDLCDAFGPATRVPRLLAAVATSRGQVLYKALDTLCEHTLHQGTIYSASPPVARAIIEFARDAEPAERQAFYGLLSEFASSARKAIADGRAIPCHSGGDPVDGRAIRDAILGAHQMFIRDLAHPVAGIRANAADLSIAFAEATPEAADLVRQRYFVEPHINVRREIIVAMVRVRDRYADWPDLLEAALLHEADPGNRYFLLQAQVVHLGPGATPATVTDLVSTFATFYGKYEFYLGGESFFEAITRLGTDRELEAMLQALAQVTGRGAVLALAERLLRLALADRRTEWGHRALSTKEGRDGVDYWGLKGEAPALPHEWSPAQSAVLRAIAAQTALWRFDTNLWDLFGLPQTAEELTRLAIRRE